MTRNELRPRAAKLRLGGLLLLGGAILQLTGCDLIPPRVWVTSQRIIELSATDVEKLAVHTLNGQVHLRAAPAGAESIVVTASIKAGGNDEADAQACLEAIEIRTPRAGDGDHVQEVRSEWRDGKKSHWQCQIAFDVAVPEKMDVFAESHNGGVVLENILSKCELSSHNGDVEVRDGATELIATTHNGTVSARTAAERVELSSHNGEIKAVLLSRGAIQGSLSSHNGQVRAAVAPEIDMNFECEARNGSIDVDVPTMHLERKRRHASGQIGGNPGSNNLVLSSHNGSVSLDPLDERDVENQRRDERRAAENEAQEKRRAGEDEARDQEREIHARARQLEAELDESDDSSGSSDSAGESDESKPDSADQEPSDD